MSFFKQIEGEAAVIIQNGIYKQCDVYSRDGMLYAKVAGGFIALKDDGSTSHATARLETLSYEDGLYRTAVGRLCTAERAGAKALPEAKAQILLGAPVTNEQ